MAKQKITGSFVALITPFNKDGSVDFAAFKSLLSFQEAHGTKAVLIMGQDEVGENADLLRLYRQQHRIDHRQRALRQG
jgi:dihydrodipicolinate synthase/N-acetylneuraminate lyase